MSRRLMKPHSYRHCFSIARGQPSRMTSEKGVGVHAVESIRFFSRLNGMSPPLPSAGHPRYPTDMGRPEERGAGAVGGRVYDSACFRRITTMTTTTRAR